MNGFHIDMNMAQFTRSYLEKWLRELARIGYDTIIWEVENNIRWETCPECVSSEAFSKQEFRELLDLCSSLGLKSIPLLQTLGHCEYVLKHSVYKHLAEVQGRIDQYCPRNPDLIPFLTRWIEEYLDLFGNIEKFHIGGDEALTLGSCDKCRAYVQASSLSELYVDHINAISIPLLNRGIQPIIWADMVLHYPQALDKLSRNIMLCDWSYGTHRSSGKVEVWGKGLQYKEEFSDKTLKIFGDFIFPLGDEPGREPEFFYTADYLAHNGFDVVVCPSSSSYGDNIFTPRYYLHLANTFDSFRKGRQASLKGSVLTSWTVHLFPYELQLSCIDYQHYADKNPEKSIEDYQRYWVETRFMTKDRSFITACGLLSKRCLFTYALSLGCNKDCQPVAVDHVSSAISRLAEEGKLGAELSNCRDRLEEYTEGLRLLKLFISEARDGKEYLLYWDLAARNLINRAHISEFILKHELAARNELPLDSGYKSHGRLLLDEMRNLREETRKKYETILKPTRRDEVIDWIFSAIEHAMMKLTDR